MAEENKENLTPESESQEQEEIQEQEKEILTPDLDEKAEKIKELEHELAVSRADFYNYRQRTIKEKSQTRQRAQEDVIIEILPVLDNLDRALESAKNGGDILSGVEMVQRQFINVLENLGVTTIKSTGENFDPALHNASGTEEVNDPELDGKIINESLRGYRTKERVLRPSHVTVGKLAN